MKDMKDSLSELRTQVELFVSSFMNRDDSQKQKMAKKLIEMGIYKPKLIQD